MSSRCLPSAHGSACVGSAGGRLAAAFSDGFGKGLAPALDYLRTGGHGAGPSALGAPNVEFVLGSTAVQSFYRYQAYVYDWTRWTILHGRRRAVARLRLRPDSQVLEVGCGTGLSFRYLLDYLDPARGRLVGLDFSPDMLRRAEKRCAARHWQNVELLEADATRIDFDRRFDGILLAYSLSMIPDWRAAIDRAHEHLKPGGRLVVLDFGRFRGWGPLAPLMRGWLRLNHVETLRAYTQGLREVFPDLQISHWLGGYNFTAVGQRSGG